MFETRQDWLSFDCWYMHDLNTSCRIQYRKCVALFQVSFSMRHSNAHLCWYETDERERTQSPLQAGEGTARRGGGQSITKKRTQEAAFILAVRVVPHIYYKYRPYNPFSCVYTFHFYIQTENMCFLYYNRQR